MTIRAIRLGILVAVLVLNASVPFAAGAAEAGVDSLMQPPMQPIAFDGKGFIQYPGVSAYQLSSGTIDLYFRAGWSGGDVDRDPAALSGSSCLITCSEDASRTRYGIYLTDHLESLGFWNGASWGWVPYPFVRDRWYHLAVLLTAHRTMFVVNGRAIGSVPFGVNSSSPGSNWDLLIGSSGQGADTFYGEIANVRIWSQPLPLSHVLDLGFYHGQPWEPRLASCLAAFTDWGAAGQGIVQVDRAAFAPALAQTIANARFLHDSLVWEQDPRKAMSAAAAAPGSIIAYTTCTDGLDPACETLERTALDSPWWRDATRGFQHLLLQSAHGQPPPMGVPIGHCAILDADGRVLRLFRPWSEGFTRQLLGDVGELVSHRDAAAPRDRARLLLHELALRDDPALRAQLRKLGGDPAVSGDSLLTMRIHQLDLLDLARQLDRDYAAGRPLAADASRKGSADVHAMYVRKALDLYLSMPFTPEPEDDLANFAELAWEGAVDEGADAVVAQVADLVLPLSTVTPALAVFVAGSTPRGLLPLLPTATSP